MKVTCQLCGTKFDMEVNRGRCPECAALYAIDEVTGNYSYENTSAELKDASYNQGYNLGDYGEDHYDEYEDDEYEDDYEFDPEMYEYYQNLRRIEAAKWNKFKKIMKCIIISVEVILIIFFALMPTLGKGYSGFRLEEQRVTEKPPIVEARRSKPMSIGDYELTVVNYYVDDKNHWELPDNYVVYAVEYEVEYMSEGYYSGGLYRFVEPYLETSTGPTIAPIDNYDASKFMVYEEYEKIDDRLESYIQISGGLLYFVAKEDEEVYGLCFDAYKGRESDEDYRELEKIYFIEAPEMEVQ